MNADDQKDLKRLWQTHILWGFEGNWMPNMHQNKQERSQWTRQKKYEWMMLAIPFPTPKFLKRSFHATPKVSNLQTPPPRVIMKVEHGSSSSGEICISTAGVVRVLGFFGSRWIQQNQRYSELVFWSWRFYMGIYRHRYYVYIYIYTLRCKSPGHPSQDVLVYLTKMRSKLLDDCGHHQTKP